MIGMYLGYPKACILANLLDHITAELSGGADGWLLFGVANSVLKNERNY
jgi:hypothetical protein